MCAWGADQKRQRLAIEVARARSETACWSYSQPLANVGSFKYCGRILLAKDDYWPSVVSNLRKEINK